MDVLPRIIRQLIELLREMSPVQRGASFAVSAMVLLGFGWILFQNQVTDFQAVSFGKVFTTDELASAEQALVSAGLTGFRRDGQRLLAPAEELTRYNAALLEFDALPADLGSQMLKQFETLGPFSTDRQRQQMKEALLLQELRRMIKAVPDVEDARVAIAASERKTSWNQKPRSTANVTVKPRAGRTLSTTLINSLRHVVANMVPDLSPADVTIFDVTRGQAFLGEPTEDSSDSLYLQRAQEFSRQYEQQIQKALSHIPQVSVAVHVDLDALKSSMVRSETVRSRNEIGQVANRAGEISADEEQHLTGFRGQNDGQTETTREVTEKTLVAAIPKAVQVSVSIPRDYLRNIVKRRISKGEKSAQRLEPDSVEEEVLTQVERIVGRLIPADSASDAISVTCVDRLVIDSLEVAASPTDESFANLVQQYRLPIALISVFSFLLMAIGMMRAKSPKAIIRNDEESIHSFDEVQAAPVEIPQVLIHPTVNVPDRTAELREEVRSLVASDPAATATLLGRWLSEAQL